MLLPLGRFFGGNWLSLRSGVDRLNHGIGLGVVFVWESGIGYGEFSLYNNGFDAVFKRLFRKMGHMSRREYIFILVKANA